MELIFVHHAMRKFGNPPSQNDGITRLGRKDAKMVGKILLLRQEKKHNIKAIYTSPFYRCDKTAKLINYKIKVPIIMEERFNELRSIPNESWLDLQVRVRQAIMDIVDRFDDDDCVVCVTSGVNIVAFMQLIFKLPPDDDAPFVQISSCSPLLFTINKDNFKLKKHINKKEKKI